MTPEEFQRLKEAEKAHLRSLQKLKEAARQLRRQQSLTQAVENIVEGPRRVLDEQEALLEQLALDTARSEARLDMAMETLPAETPPALSDEEAEEALRAQRAQALLRQLKQEMGAPEAPPSATPLAPDAPQEKTLGGPRTRRTSDLPDSLPDKTLGRP